MNQTITDSSHLQDIITATKKTTNLPITVGLGGRQIPTDDPTTTYQTNISIFDKSQ